jgi:hypothetical protein
MYFSPSSTLFKVEGIFRFLCTKGKSVERRRRKAAKLTLSVGNESYAGWAAKGRKHGGVFLSPLSLPPELTCDKGKPAERRGRKL